MARVLEDSPKVLLSNIGPKLQYRVPSALVPIIQSFSAIKPAKLKAIFEKSKSDAIERHQHEHPNGEEVTGRLPDGKSFVSLDRGLGMLVEAEWVGVFTSGVLRDLVRMTLSEA